MFRHFMIFVWTIWSLHAHILALISFDPASDSFCVIICNGTNYTDRGKNKKIKGCPEERRDCRFETIVFG